MRIALLAVLLTLASRCLVNSISFAILHTSDFHSHFEGIGPDHYVHLTQGHAARFATIVKRVQSVYKQRVLTVDAGDWFSGTMFHLLTSSYLFSDLPPIELHLLDKLGFDATTLGNHEFDLTEEGLGRVLQKAQRTGLSIPIITSNLYFSENCNSSLRNLLNASTENVSFLPPRSVSKQYDRPTSLIPFLLKEIRDEKSNQVLRIGIIGLTAPHATKVSSPDRSCSHFIGFNDKTQKLDSYGYADFVYRRATELRKQHAVDVMIALVHGGNPDDVALMKSLQYKGSRYGHQAPIDIHISAHTHDQELHVFRNRDYVEGDTSIHSLIHQSGPYGVAVGVLQLDYNFETKRLHFLNQGVPLKDYFHVDSLISENQLVPIRIPVNAHIPFDDETFNRVEKYKQLINKELLVNTPYRYDTVVGHFSTNFSSPTELGRWLCDILLQQFCRVMVEKESSANRLLSQVPKLETLSNDTMLLDTTNYCGEHNKDRVDFYMTAVDAIRIHDLKHYNRINESILFQLSDAYRVFGVGNMLPYQNGLSIHYASDPITHFYLEKSMVVTLIQVIKILSYFDPVSTMTYSHSLSWRERWWGIPFVNRIYDVRVHGVKLEQLERPYVHTALPYYVAKFFSLARELSYGITEISMRDKRGNILPSVELAKSFHYEFMLLAHHMRSQIKQ